MSSNVRWFADLGLADLEQVGGKNASLGDMVRNLTDVGVRVPNGFATTADAYRRFLSKPDESGTSLADRISARLADLDTDDVQALAEAGREIRAAVMEQPFPEDLEADSFAPHLLDADQKAKDVVFSEIGNLRSMIREGDYKYVHGHDGEHELYNLVSDPGEYRNLFGNPEYADKTRELYERISQWRPDLA